MLKIVKRVFDIGLISWFSYDVHTVGLAPGWVDISEEVAANINQTRVKMAELVKAHAEALTPSFIDGEVDQCRIEALTQDITDLLRKSEKTLQNLSAGGRSEDSTVKRNVQRSLATDLQNLSMELRKKQSIYLKCLHQQTEGLDALDWKMNLNGTSCNVDDEISGMGFNEHQMAKLKNNNQFSEDRETEIKQVMKSVNELAQIMKDISVLVIDQGTIVDRIDHNVQSVAASVEEGTKQLRKVFFCLFLICACMQDCEQMHRVFYLSVVGRGWGGSCLYRLISKTFEFISPNILMLDYRGLKFQAKRNQKEGGMVRCATVLFIMCFVLLMLLVFKEILV
ncbi:PREDICTED: syntaxin-41-like isoform X2 [Ipomoea nil]|uniref:syntaxin-41-like isoform X2 n=1 Tax=Ipomoea nil TaxID=35883 RepID=UPI000900CF69|nr:PREDICTED: syntaxin-41-like isoform X2 [Ipomoea nil]